MQPSNHQTRTGSIRGLRRGALALSVALVVVGSLGRVRASAQENRATSSLTFVDVTQELGITFSSTTGDDTNDYILEANGNGAALFDFDFDGDLDLVLLSGSTIDRFEHEGGQRMIALYRNEGAAGFEDRTTLSGLDYKGWGMGACVGDFDRDGWEDLYVSAFGPNLLFHNNGDGTFSEVAASLGLADTGWSHSCVFADFDRDGDPDLFVTNYLDFDRRKIPARGDNNGCSYEGHPTSCGPLGLEPQHDSLYRNEGGAGFIEVETGAPARFAMGVVFSDLGGSGQPDFFVSNDSQYNSLLRLAENPVREEALLFGLAVNELGKEQASMGIATGDYDNDLDLDLVVTNFAEDYNTLYRNLGQGMFIDYSLASGLAQPTMEDLSWGTALVDLDNDGWLDLFIANGHIDEYPERFGFGSTYLQPNRVFLNTRDGRLLDVSASAGEALAIRRSSRGLAKGDFDGDGDVDLVVVNMNALPTILRNDTVTQNGYLRLVMRTGPGRPDPVGSQFVLRVAAGERFAELTGGGSYLSQNEPVVHFGLGDAVGVDRLELRPLIGPKRVFLDLGVSKTLIFDAGSPPDPHTTGSK